MLVWGKQNWEQMGLSHKQMLLTYTKSQLKYTHYNVDLQDNEGNIFKGKFERANNVEF